MNYCRLLLCVLLSVLLTGVSLYAQGGSIKGTVVDAKTKQRLASATVALIPAASSGGATNARGAIGRVANKQGQFEFTDIAAGIYLARVTYISYATLEKKVTVLQGQTATLNLELVSDVKGLTEVVVTGVASRTEKSVAEVAVSHVDAAALTEGNAFQGHPQIER